MLATARTAANIAITENCYALFGRGDIEGLLSNFTEDGSFELVGDRAMVPIFGLWEGRTGVAKFFATVGELLEFSEFSLTALNGVDDKVFVEGNYAMTVKATGKTIESRWQSLYTFRDGLVSSVREHTDTARFVAAWQGGAAAHVTLVQQAYGHFAKGDIPALLSLCAPDIVWISGGSGEDFPTFGRREGRDGTASFFADVARYDRIAMFEPREFIPGNDKVAVIGRYAITATATGKPFESDWVHVYTIRNGMISMFQEYTDTAAFLKAGRA
jgi:ketosteroid isomerase-like protein